VDRLGQLSDHELDAVVARSDADFATAAGQPDLLGSRPLHAPTPAEPTDRSAAARRGPGGSSPGTAPGAR
jgi:hypothetical protein